MFPSHARRNRAAGRRLASSWLRHPAAFIVHREKKPQDRSDADLAGTLSAQVLIIAQPIPGFERREKVQRLECELRGTGEFRTQCVDQVFAQRSIHRCVFALKELGVNALECAGMLERGYALIQLGSPVDQRAHPLLAVSYRDGLPEEWSHLAFQAPRKLGEQSLHVREVPKDGPFSDPSPVGYLLSGRNQLAGFDQLEQRVGDAIPVPSAPQNAAILDRKSVV